MPLSRRHELRSKEAHHEGPCLPAALDVQCGLTVKQEYGECQADTPPGMKINFDEGNMTEWEVLLDGPDQSVYAVRRRSSPSCRAPD